MIKELKLSIEPPSVVSKPALKPIRSIITEESQCSNQSGQRRTRLGSSYYSQVETERFDSQSSITELVPIGKP